MSISSRRKIWTLISPHSRNKNKTKACCLENCVSLRMLFLDVRPHDRLSTAAINRKTVKKCPKHWNLIWPCCDLCLQAQQGSSLLGQHITGTRLIQTCTGTDCCAREHENIIWSFLCVSVFQKSSRERPWPPESAIDHLALLGVFPTAG